MTSGHLPDLPPGVTRTIKPNKTYWYYTPNRGKPNEGKRSRLPEHGTPEWHDELARIRREQRGEPPDQYDMRGLVRDYKVTAGWRQLERNTVETYESALKPILASWKFQRPADIAISDVMALLERLADRPSSANMTLVMVKKLMRYAIQKGLRSDNPAREVDKLEENPDGAKPIDAPAWAALTGDDAPEAIRRLAILGRATGQRISDLIRLRPCDRDQDGITTTITKLRGQEHWCPLTQAEAAIIDGWGQFGNAPYVIRPDGKRCTEDTMRNAWNAFKATDAGKVLRDFTPHDLRATKVCDERIAGKSHQQIAAMVGMSAPMVMKYSRRIDQRLVARNTANPAGGPREIDMGPMGRIRDLDEVAAYLRAPADRIAAIAQQYGLGAVFGETLSFTEEDIRALWERSRQPPKPSP